MRRAELPGAPARPTLFDSARPSEATAHTVRMLPQAAPPAAPFSLWRRVAAGSAVLAIAAAGAIGLHRLAPATRVSDAPAVSINVPAADTPPAGPAVTAAVIESVAPVKPSPVREAAPGPVADRVARPMPTRGIQVRAMTAGDARPARPGPGRNMPPAPSTADADVDLLAAMVTRLQAADTAVALPPRPARATDDARATAR